jgi:predicted HTH transcriptional regulator
MITKDEIQELLHSTETYRVERTTSTGDMDKFQEAICAFANDLPNSRKNGYLILGAYVDGGNVGGKTGGDIVDNVVGKDLNDVEKPSDVVENVVENKENVVENILASISKNSTISTKELAAMCSLSERQVQRIMAKLKKQGVIRRIGPDKGGHWEIIAP